jgi:enoyl-CoA hydratase/carnithine racemase
MFFLAGAEPRAVDDRALEELLARAEMTVAAGAEEIRGLSAAALLFADYAVLDAGATLHLDVAEAWAGVAWRLGHEALRMHIQQRTTFSAAEARNAGLCDEVIDGDPQEWLDRWMQGRSAVALDSAAMLIRARGGDALERTEFARLFAIGEPQRGLTAFLNRRSPKT